MTVVACPARPCNSRSVATAVAGWPCAAVSQAAVNSASMATSPPPCGPSPSVRSSKSCRNNLPLSASSPNCAATYAFADST
ncbi:hypothetical protein [Micromonospora sp. NPDC005254]|uniref:hypothetical protein n=1 Tax=Micromonospora sp. NPDC005254 TaxID=3364229 RepID=UPI00368081BA